MIALIDLWIVMGVSACVTLANSKSARVAGGWIVACFAAACLWQAAPPSRLPAQWHAEARLDALAPGGRAVVEFEVARPLPENERDVRRVPLRRPVEGVLPLLWGALALGIAAVAAGARPRLGAALGAAASGAALAAAGLMANASGAGGGEADIRAAVAALGEGVAAFTVPETPWRWWGGPVWATGLVGLVGLVASLPQLPMPAERSQRAAAVLGAALASAALAARAFAFDGVVFDHATGLLWAAWLALVVAAIEPDARRRGSLAAAAAALCAAGLGV